MKKTTIIRHLRSASNGNLTKKEKDALREAIKIIQKDKGEFDPAWIAVVLQALGIGIDIFQNGP